MFPVARNTSVPSTFPRETFLGKSSLVATRSSFLDSSDEDDFFSEDEDSSSAEDEDIDSSTLELSPPSARSTLEEDDELSLPQAESIIAKATAEVKRVLPQIFFMLTSFLPEYKQKKALRLKFSNFSD